MFSKRKFTDVKPLINLALTRLNTVRKKVNQELAAKKRILAKNIQDCDFALARLEAERIVKLDWKMEALNMIEIKCEEVRDNVVMLNNQKEIPSDLDEALSTVVYCNGRADIPELNEVVRVLERKYGQEWIKMQENNGAQRVDERLIHRLSGQRPNAFLVYSYMKEIAVQFDVVWQEDEATKVLGERFDVPMSAGAPGVASASGLGAGAYAVTDGRILPHGQKPPGFVPPSAAELVEIPDASPVEDADENQNDDGEEGGDDEPPAPKPKAVAKPPAVPKPKAPTPKPAAAKPKPAPAPAADPTPPPAAPKKNNDLADLESRFKALKDL